MNPQKGSSPSESKPEPAGTVPGTEKEPPASPQPAPMDSTKPQDPNSGSTAKPATPQKPNESPMGGTGGTAPNDKQDPAANAGAKAKPMPEPARGADKNPAPQPGQPKMDEKQAKELADAAKDLTSPDKGKREAAEQKLDKAVGEEKRKELQQLRERSEV